MDRISSRQNAIVRRFRAVARAPRTDGSARELLLDGPHLLEEAMSSGVAIEIVAVREGAAAGALAGLLDCARRRDARVLEVTEGVLAAMSPVRQPGGVVAIARHPGWTLGEVLARAPQLILVLADVQDPGNVGAIVRVADACGATGIVPSAATADPFGWKALRGSMGSVFRLPVAPRERLEPALQALRHRGVRTYAALPRGGTPLPRCDMRGPVAIVLGGEGAGVPPSLLEACDGALSIPMRRNVDSLNVATAAALVTYEAQRQRQTEDAA
jgi:TrmH family RNA methyltransferase